MLPLAVFYQSSDYLVTARGRISGNVVLAQYQQWGEGEDGDIYAETPVVFVGSASLAGGLLESFGLEVQAGKNLEERRRAVFSGVVPMGEFTKSEIMRLDWEGSEMTVLNLGYSMSPRFLMAESERFAALPPRYQAAFTEAAAYLFPLIDGAIRDQEAELSVWLRQQGVIVEPSYPALKEAGEQYVLNHVDGNPRGKYLYDILRTLE